MGNKNCRWKRFGWPPGQATRECGRVSGAGMTIPVIPQICSTARIIGPEPLHAVSDPVTGRRTVGHGRRIIAGTVVTVRGSQRAAYDCPRDQSSGNRSAPSPAAASPLHGLSGARDRFGERTRLTDRCRTCSAGEHGQVGRKQGRYEESK